MTLSVEVQENIEQENKIMTSILLKDTTQINYQQARLAHWNAVAQQLDTWTGWGGYYHQRLTQIYKFLVAPGQRVIEIGCARGD